MAMFVAIAVTPRTTLATSPTELNFDDLPKLHFVTGTTYAGLTWEEGNLGVGGNVGVWSTGGILSYPHSPPVNLINGYGCTMIGIGFPAMVDMSGAYVGQQGNGGFPSTTGVRVHGYLDGVQTGVTAWFTDIQTDPQWFDMSILTNVDRIVFESVPVYDNGGSYGLDNLTFTYVPEPAGLAALSSAAAALLARRRKTRGMESVSK